MKKMTLSVMAVAAMSSSVLAGGDIVPVPVMVDSSGFYVGATIAYQRTYSIDSAWFGKADTQDQTGALGLVVGYDYNEYLAFEGRIATTVFEEDYADVTTYSIFLKPQYPVTEDFSIYALLGYGNTKVKGSDGGGLSFGFDPTRIGDTIMDESGFQWGLGVSYAVTEKIDVTFDYVSYANDADITPTALYWYNGSLQAHGPFDKLSDDALTLGIIYKF